MKMLVRDTDQNIKDYYNQVKDQYPNLTLEDFTKICKAPFSFFRKAIASGNFPTIMIKYFGKFIPFRNFKDKQNEEAKTVMEQQAQAIGHVELRTGELPVQIVVPEVPDYKRPIDEGAHPTTNQPTDW